MPVYGDIKQYLEVIYEDTVHATVVEIQEHCFE